MVRRHLPGVGWEGHGDPIEQGGVTEPRAGARLRRLVDQQRGGMAEPFLPFSLGRADFCSHVIKNGK